MRFYVGQVIQPDEIQWLPDGAKISISEKQYIVAELPKTSVEELADELTLEFGTDIPYPTGVATWILRNFDRKGQPEYVIDVEGDRWERNSDGSYSYILSDSYDPMYQNWTLDRIADEIGLA